MDNGDVIVNSRLFVGCGVVVVDRYIFTALQVMAVTLTDILQLIFFIFFCKRQHFSDENVYLLC